MNSSLIYTGDPKNLIVVVGYPKSGNTWLSRLIADALDSPVGGYERAKPLAEEGHDRPGKYYVTQLHSRPIYINSHPGIIDPWNINIPKLKGEKIVHICRDPRDIAVSAKHYWEIESINDALYSMAYGTNPFAIVKDWPSFVDSWVRYGLHHYNDFYQTSYETLYADPHETIAFILDAMGVDWDRDRLPEVIERQSFSKKKEYISVHGNDYNYGMTIQLKLLRNGKPGDWINHFSEEDERRAALFFGIAASGFGYDLTSKFDKEENSVSATWNNV